MSFARTLVVLALVFIVGMVGYQIGIGQNIAAQLPAGAAPLAYYGYGYPYHFGFGFLGFLFPLFFLFLIFGLLRAALWGGRGGWKGGSGPGRHWGGYGRLEEIHRELHGEKPSDKTGGPAGPAT